MRRISQLFAFFGKSLKFTLEIDGKGDPSYKNRILHFSAHNTNFKGCNAFNQPYLPNCTRFWVINMSSIAVIPSTNGQYGGLEPNCAFYPPNWIPVDPLTLSMWWLIHGHSI